MKKKLFILLLSIISVICFTFGLSACGGSGGGSDTSESETISVTSVTLSKSSLDLTVEDGYSLTATISPSNATNKNVTWSSSNTSVATVSNGKITAVSAGSVTITVKTEDGGYTATCSVKVTEATSQTVSVTSVSLDYSTLSLEVGESSTLTATVLPSNATNKSITWSTSDNTVATVTNGTVTAVSAGTAVIIVTTADGGKVATCTVTVTEPTIETIAVTSVSLDTNSLSLTVGESSTLTATVLPSNATNQNIIWSSSDESIATVDSGIVTAVAAGTVTITVTTEDGGYAAECIVTVEEEPPETVAVTSVTLNTTNISLDIGGTYTLIATISPSNATNQNVTWSSSDCTIATVSNGVVAAVSAGTVTITVTTEDGGYTAECFVTVEEETPETVAVTSVSLNTNLLSLTVGDSSTLVATVLPSNATNQNVTWSSSDCTIATVSNGVVAAVSAGTVTITVTTEDGGYTAECTVTVEEETPETVVTSVSLNITNINLDIGGSYTLIATISPSNATNQNITWSSSNTSVATINNGTVTAIAAGTATISVTTEDGNYTTECFVSVSAAVAAVLNVNNATINGSYIYLLADYTTTSISLSGAVTCSDNSSWKLYSSDGITEIPTKVITSLADGTNTYYIVVTSTLDSTVSNTYILTVYKSFAVTVSYYNGNSVIKTETVYTGYSYSADYTPDITGYTFNYWKTADRQAYSATIILADLSLYADTTANTYTITYDANGGAVTETETTVTYDSSYTFAVPERTGYTFNGWYYGDTQLTDENGNSLNVWNYTEDLTVTADWSVNSYTVSLELSDSSAGSVTGSGTYKYNTQITITATTNSGYTWVGWYNGDTLVSSDLSYTFFIPAENITYTAMWTCYTVTTSVNDENAGSVTEYSETKVTVGEEITITAITNTGYTWVGWYNGEMLVSSDLSYTFFMPAENITYTATWTYYTLTTSVNDKNAGSVTEYNETKVTVGEEITITATTNTGYTWVGWYNGNTLLTSDLRYTFIMAAEDVTYTATWTYYTVTTSVNDKNAGSVTEYSETKVTAGEEITITATTNTGYTWVGWYNGETLVSSDLSYMFTMPAENITYTATWTYYTVTTTKNDSSAGTVTNYSAKKVTVGEEVTVTATTNNGYTWVGWYNGEILLTSDLSYTFFMPSENIIYTARWSKTTLSVNDSSAGSISTLDKTYTVGDEVTISATNYLGYTLIGWYKDDTLYTTDYSFTYTLTAEDTSFIAYYEVDNMLSNFVFTSTTTTCEITGLIDNTVTEIVVPDYVTAISEGVFCNCTSLTSITIGNDVTTIGGSAFGTSASSGCTSLTSVYYNGTASQWASISFGNDVANPLYYAGNLYLDGTLVTDITIEGITTINSCAFFYCTSLKSVTIGDDITSIGSGAFYDCSALTSVTIGNSVSSICESAFRNCTLLENITISDSVISIGQYVFCGCTSLESVTIGDTVETIGLFAFYDCTSLKNVYYSGMVSQWANITFSGSSANPLYYADNLYLNGTLATDITLEGITTIKNYTFYNCTSLESVTVGNSVISIGSDAFYNCTSLTSVTV